MTIWRCNTSSLQGADEWNHGDQVPARARPNWPITNRRPDARRFWPKVPVLSLAGPSSVFGPPAVGWFHASAPCTSHLDLPRALPITQHTGVT
eukprot:4488459-Prymnesium_polylepis.1